MAACGGSRPSRARLSVATSWGPLAATSLQQELLAIAEALGAVEIDIQVLDAQVLQELLTRQAPAVEETHLDLAVVPNDWLPRLAQRGVLAELPPSRIAAMQEQLFGQAVLAVTEGDRVLAYPLSGEVLAFVYNSRFFPSPPRSIDDVVASVALPPGVVPFAFDVANPQHVVPLAASLGALPPDETGVPPVTSALLDELLSRLAPIWANGSTWRLFHGDDLESLHVQLFAEGRLASFIGGPWLLEALEASGQPVGVLPIPPVTAAGTGSAAFVGYQCVGVIQTTPWLDVALEVGARLSTGEANDRLNRVIRRLPVRAEAYRSRSSMQTPGTLGFLRALEEGRSLPATSAGGQRLRELGDLLARYALQPAPFTGAGAKTGRRP